MLRDYPCKQQQALTSVDCTCHLWSTYWSYAEPDLYMFYTWPLTRIWFSCVLWPVYVFTCIGFSCDLWPVCFSCDLWPVCFSCDLWPICFSCDLWPVCFSCDLWPVCFSCDLWLVLVLSMTFDLYMLYMWPLTCCVSMCGGLAPFHAPSSYT